MKGQTPSRSVRLVVAGAAFGVVLIAMAFWLGGPDRSARQPVSLSEVAAAAKAGTVARLTIIGPRLLVEYRDGRPPDEARIEPDVSLFTQLALYGIPYDRLTDMSITVSDEQGLGRWLGVALTLVPLLLFGGMLLLLLRRGQCANNQALSFGKSRARLANSTLPTITFADVAGVEEACVELLEVV